MSPNAITFSCHVLLGTSFAVTSGANQGDALGSAGDLCAGDIYRLESGATTLQMAIADGGTGSGRVLSSQGCDHHIAAGSELGKTGAQVTLQARLTLLAPEGHKIELLVMSVDQTIVALPLIPLEPGRDHTLVGIDLTPEAVRLADITSMAFARGTRITLANGAQRSVEDLSQGDQILTRDHGAQPLRWISHRTMRGVGPHAPVVIPRDTFGNAADLVISQHQRLFIYQRSQERLTDTAEMLVRAHYLVDAQTIFLREGGWVDYYTLVFDSHEVIYAECIPVESLEVNGASLTALDQDLAREVVDAMPNLNHRPHAGIDADQRLAIATRQRLLGRG